MSEHLSTIMAPDSRPLIVSSFNDLRGPCVQLTIDTAYVQLNRWGAAQLCEIIADWLSGTRAKTRQRTQREHLTPNELLALRKAVSAFVTMAEALGVGAVTQTGVIADVKDAMAIINAREGAE